MDITGRSPPFHAVVLLKTTQIVGPTQAWSSSGLGQTPGKRAKASTRERQFMSVLSLEVFGMLVSGANLGYSDSLNPVSSRHAGRTVSGSERGRDCCGLLRLSRSKRRRRRRHWRPTPVRDCHRTNDYTDPRRLRDHPIETVDTELELLNRVTDIIVELDPDILAGWEIQSASWGYCDARGRAYGVSTV